MRAILCMDVCRVLNAANVHVASFLAMCCVCWEVNVYVSPTRRHVHDSHNFMWTCMRLRRSLDVCAFRWRCTCVRTRRVGRVLHFFLKGVHACHILYGRVTRSMAANVHVALCRSCVAFAGKRTCMRPLLRGACARFRNLMSGRACVSWDVPGRVLVSVGCVAMCASDAEHMSQHILFSIYRSTRLSQIFKFGLSIYLSISIFYRRFYYCLHSSK